jgi:hypothetical protein
MSRLLTHQRRSTRASELDPDATEHGESVGSGEKQVADGETAIAQSWIQSHEELLEEVQASLAVADDQSNEDGTYLQPFSGKPPQFAAKKD